MKYLSISSLLLINISLNVCTESELNEEHVIVLNKQNFDTVINNNDFVLVQFYAPLCGACEALAPEYTKAAQTIPEKSSKIKIAKINAIEETAISEKYGIDGYPTIRFFRKNSTPLDYKGLRLADHIASWVIKRTGPPAIQLTELDEAKELIEDNEVVTIGFFENYSDETVKIYLSAAELSDDSVFAITTEESIFKFFEVKPRGIILFNKEYESQVVFNKEFTEHEIVKFVKTQSLPLVMEFTSENAMHIFGGYIKTHILLFLPKSSPDTVQHLHDVTEIAKEFKEDVLFTLFDTDSSEHKALFEYLGLTEFDSIPAVRLIHFGKQLIRYKPHNPEITKSNIQNFLKNFFDGKLKRILRSEILPENWNKEPVYVLVADNFESVVMDPTKDVLVQYYAPWCRACQKFASVYESIGKHYSTQENIIIAKIDASANEFEDKIIESLPTITLYTKDNKVVDYTGEQTFKAVVRFIDSGGVILDDQEQYEDKQSEAALDNDYPSYDDSKDEL